MQPRTIYRIVAVAEMITWALLLTGMALKYSSITDVGVRVAGSVHGLAFLSYVAITVLVWINQRWGFGTGVAGLVSSVVPFATVFFEKHVERRGMLSGKWQFRSPDTATPQGFAERVLAFSVRRPFVAAALVACGVVVVFFLLLQAGPPTEWFS